MPGRSGKGHNRIVWVIASGVYPVIAVRARTGIAGSRGQSARTYRLLCFRRLASAWQTRQNRQCFLTTPQGGKEVRGPRDHSLRHLVGHKPVGRASVTKCVFTPFLSLYDISKVKDDARRSVLGTTDVRERRGCHRTIEVTDRPRLRDRCREVGRMASQQPLGVSSIARESFGFKRLIAAQHGTAGANWRCL
jgi:hypothetical protein